MQGHKENLEERRLAALYRYEVLDTEPEVAFDRIAALASKVFDTPVALISLVDKDRLWFKACYGLGVREADSRLSLCDHAIQGDSVVVVPDTLQDVRFARSALVTGEPKIRFYAGAPLKTSDGHNLGTLCVIDLKPREPLSDKGKGMLADLAATVVDALELRQVSRTLRSSEEKLRAVVESVSDAVYIKDLEGRYLLINPAGAGLLEYSAHEVLGKRDDALFGPAAAAYIRESDRQVTASGEPLTYEEAVEVAGESKAFLTSKYPYRSPEGTPIGIIGVSSDITERSRAREALARSNALLRATFDATAEGVLSVDERGRVTDYNRRYLEMWRVPQAVVASGDDEALVQHALAQVKHPEAFLEGVQAAYKDPEGETYDEVELAGGRMIERVSLPQRVGDRVVGRVWSFQDVTSRHRAERSLKELNGELEARVEARTAELEASKSELEQVNRQLLHDAFYDKLTGLPNRALLLDRLNLVLARAQRQDERSFAVLFVGLERFRVVNGSFGRAVGDALLIEVGKRLSRCLRPGDTVARLGEDVFCVLLEALKEPNEVERVVMRIMQEVRNPFRLGGHLVYSTVSVGVVLGDARAYDDTGYGEAEGVVRDAELAMNRAKALGRSRSHIFSVDLRERAASLSALESELYGAAGRGELRVFYQPVVALKGGRLAGFEALVRWQHPTLGLVSPAEFVPIAEESGVIIELDRWVLREACGQLSRWQQQLPLTPPLTLNVNLSNQQFLRPDLVDYVREVLATTGVQPGHLQLELTESALVESSDAIDTVFGQLKAAGVKLYLDDFGTGYSSLSYLQRFPVDALKVDRSFVHHMTTSPERAELVKTIVSMAHTLELSVVAEGVETEAQRAQLAALGCTYAQGYLFAQPLGADEATTFLKKMRKTARRGLPHSLIT